MSASRKLWGDEQRAYQKRRRDTARAAGLCIQCTKRPRLPNLSRCESCLDKSQRVPRATAPARNPTSVRFCVECLAAGFHRADCAADRRNTSAA